MTESPNTRPPDPHAGFQPERTLFATLREEPTTGVPIMPWLTFRDQRGQTLETSECHEDCEARLLEAVQLRRAKGWTLTQAAAGAWEANSAAGELQRIQIEAGVPQFPLDSPK